MTTLIAMLRINLFVWVGLVGTALWQQRSDQTPPAEAGVGLAAHLIPARSHV